MGSATFFENFHSFSIKTQHASIAKTSRRLHATSSEDFVLKAGGKVEEFKTYVKLFSLLFFAEHILSSLTKENAIYHSLFKSIHVPAKAHMNLSIWKEGSDIHNLCSLMVQK